MGAGGTTKRLATDQPTPLGVATINHNTPETLNHMTDGTPPWSVCTMVVCDDRACGSLMFWSQVLLRCSRRFCEQSMLAKAELGDPRSQQQQTNQQFKQPISHPRQGCLPTCADVAIGNKSTSTCYRDGNTLRVRSVARVRTR